MRDATDSSIRIGTVAAVVLVLVALQLADVGAFSAHEFDEDSAVSICVRDSLSDVTRADIDAQLDFVEFQWELVRSVESATALTIIVTAPGPSCIADFQVRSFSEANGPVGALGSDYIGLNDFYDFSKTPEVNHYDVGARARP